MCREKFSHTKCFVQGLATCEMAGPLQDVCTPWYHQLSVILCWNCSLSIAQVGMYGEKLQGSLSRSWWLPYLFCHPHGTWFRAGHQAADSKGSGSFMSRQLAFLLGSLYWCWNFFLCSFFPPLPPTTQGEIETYDSPNTTLRICLNKLLCGLAVNTARNPPRF